MKSCYRNILETSTVTLSAGTANSSYPVYRLSDRSIRKMFMLTAAETLEVKIDQGASPLPIDRLLVPSGHNFAGMTLDIKWSDDDVTYTAAIAQWIGAAGDINKTWASLTKRYWKFIITSPASIPYFAELFLGSTYTWEKAPARPTGPLEPILNVETRMTAGGSPRFCVHGSPRRQRVYPMTRASNDTQLANILALYEAWAGSKPFWLEDHLGAWIYGYLRKPIDIKEIAFQKYPFVLDFEEILA